MGSPVLNESIFAAETITETFPKTPIRSEAEWGPNTALTGRAVIAVSGLGAGFWYVLWKIALHFVAGR